MKIFDLKEQRDHLWSRLHELAKLTPFPTTAFAETLESLSAVDRFWAYPGHEVLCRISQYLKRQQFSLLLHIITNCCHQLNFERYRLSSFIPFQTNLEKFDKPALFETQHSEPLSFSDQKPYFEVLIVHPFPETYEKIYRQQLASFITANDEFLYDIVLVSCAEDALTAILCNTDIQACVYLDDIAAATEKSADLFANYTRPLLFNTQTLDATISVAANLCRTIRDLRPSLDHYLISNRTSVDLAWNIRSQFDRVLFHLNPFRGLHDAIINGLRNRLSTPFFDALRTYSLHPKTTFHALPLSRGASVRNSPWIRDMLDFYGENIFQAETSSTQGGLDSLLDPTGAIKQAHLKAATTFGAHATYFVTNGTSTSNKIVMQANLGPGDIVLISSDSHKSIPYAVTLSGAYPIFLEPYPLTEHDLCGGTELSQIKAVLLDLKTRGLLHRLKQITLTNSTFDGVIYNCEKFMMEILAIKPDIIFHWDEAWFAFAYFHPLYIGFTAMSAARKIRERLKSPDYLKFFEATLNSTQGGSAEEQNDYATYPDPALVKLRVYVTQSTHKTLTAFRQGSMIHVADDCFNEPRFLETFRIHTSTSPNYQLVASLDIGRRQVALEGFQLVRRSILLSLQLRQRINESDTLRPYFSILHTDTLIPAKQRSQRNDVYESLNADTIPIEDTNNFSITDTANLWLNADFCVDPTRITLGLRNTGIDGSSFRQLMMTRYDIQVNKTSRNTVLFIINIGATQATIDYLFQVLNEMADLFRCDTLKKSAKTNIHKDTPFPGQRNFHSAFLPLPGGKYSALNIRDAYYRGLDASQVYFIPLSAETIKSAAAGFMFVSASFVIPYPPGFPVLVPGQIITLEILTYFQQIRVSEIHGYSFDQGFKVFKNDCLINSERIPDMNAGALENVAHAGKPSRQG